MIGGRLKGFSLIDVIVGAALLLILFLALFGTLRASLMLSALTKANTAGAELANSHMEYLRGLSYANLGTVGGIPAGPVPQTTTSVVGGITYTLRTFITYFDDSADGLGVNDRNMVITDYKKARVSVSYVIHGRQRSINLVSNFAPPSLETATGGGTLSIHVVNAQGVGLAGASVRILNTSTTPGIDLTTVSNNNGRVIIHGATPSSEYQIFVSKTGHSSAQTHARTEQNVNPTPGFLTVSRDHVTNATFSIDRLSTLTLSSFSPHQTSTFADLFADSSRLATTSSATVSGTGLALVDGALSGTARSMPITPNRLTGWGILSASISTTTGTTAIVRIADGNGVNLPDSVLPGNTIGFSSFPISLTTIQVESHPSLSLVATLNRVSTTTASPSISAWSLSHTSGPFPLPNLAYTLTGAKTIGTGETGLPIHKTVVNDTTGPTAERQNILEWDTYSLVLPNVPLIESCSPAPYALAPASVTAISLLAGQFTAHYLPIIVRNNAGAPIPSARVTLEKSGYAATIRTSLCGFAYFGGLASGTYGATVSAMGHATTTFPGIIVHGATAPSILVLP